MKQENSITMFIFLLVANFYLYFISGVSSIRFVNTYGEIVSTIMFSLILFGLYMTSIRSEFKTRSLYFFYFGLFIVSLLILVFQFFSINVDTIVQYYFGLAILIALFISIIDYRLVVINRAKTLLRCKMEATEMKKDISKLHSDISIKDEQLRKKDAKYRTLSKELASYQDQAQKIEKQLSKSSDYVASLNDKIGELKDKNKKLSKDKKKTSEIKANQKKLEREIKKSKKEMQRQEDLKSQYSKTLRNIRQKKKEQQELLVVSSDGASVHRPHCIVVRNVPKENRKLVKNWGVAKKEGYKGCGLCKPHIKPKFILKNDIKYGFIASKASDKVHKASCTLVKRIATKDRDYFRSYKAALKKGYTACRVCNPEQ